MGFFSVPPRADGCDTTVPPPTAVPAANWEYIFCSWLEFSSFSFLLTCLSLRHLDSLLRLFLLVSNEFLLYYLFWGYDSLQRSLHYAMLLLIFTN